MIDYVKFTQPLSSVHDLRKIVPFYGEVDPVTGDIKPGSEKAIYHNFEIRITRLNLLYKGSLHKLFNTLNGHGPQNHNDFDLKNLDWVIGHLEEKFHFHREDARIQNVEIGVNIEVSILPEKFLEQNLLSFRNKRPSLVNHFNAKGNFTEFTSSQYYLKIYSKQKQYGLKEPILRLEIKTRKSQVVGRYGIKYLGDLLDKSKLLKTKQLLLRCINDSLILDSLDFDFSNVDDRIFMANALLPGYWSTLKENRSPSTVYRRKQKLKTLLEQSGLDTIHDEIRTKVNEKFDELCKAR